MKIRILIARAGAFRWQVGLAARLRAAGHAVACIVEASGDALPRSLALLLDFEALLHGLGGARPSERLDPREFEHEDFEGAPDLILDLRGGAGTVTADCPVLEPLFDGEEGLPALVAALLDRRAPVLSIRSGEVLLASGLPALERPDILTLGLDQVFSRLADLLARAVAHLAAGREPDPQPAEVFANGRHPSPAGFAAAALARKVEQRLRKLLGANERWHVGWRRLDGGPSLLQTRAWHAASYSWLEDDGERFFADPFPVEHEGRIVVLCEEFPFRTQKGVIAAFTIGPDGRASPPRTVLERPYHLSYPFVFREGGAIWMIPESSQNRTIELYRADPFPDRWTLERVLVAGIAAADATLVRHGGRLWLFATASEPYGSSWDALHLFHTQNLLGEWRPHSRNPVLVDASAARPAGAVIAAPGLIRPAQDCRAGYGAGLALCAVERLDPEDYSQRVLARLAPPPAWRVTGTHTINAASGFETIDCFGPRPPPPAA